jgi:hypothetical protein
MIESALIETDEGGFVLVLDGTERYTLPQDAAERLYNSARVEVLPWITEREEALRAYKAHVGAFHCDPDESAGAYELSDPKHRDWHSVHVDHYDNREGK